MYTSDYSDPAKELVFAPAWIEQTLKRNKLDLDQILNFESLSSVCPLNDLVTMAKLNGDLKHVGLPEISYQYKLYDCWSDTVGTEEKKRYFNEQVWACVEGKVFDDELDARLFDPDQLTERKPPGAVAFNIYDITAKHALIVIYPGFFARNGAREQASFALIEAIVKQLYVYASTDRVACTPVFHQYLGLLSKKRIV